MTKLYGSASNKFSDFRMTAFIFVLASHSAADSPPMLVLVLMLVLSVGSELDFKKLGHPPTITILPAPAAALDFNPDMSFGIPSMNWSNFVLTSTISCGVKDVSLNASNTSFLSVGPLSFEFVNIFAYGINTL